MELLVPYKEFTEKIQGFKERIKEISAYPLSDENELTLAEQEFAQLKNEVESYLSAQLSNDIAREITQTFKRENAYHIPGQKPFSQLKRDFLNRLTGRKEALDSIMALLEISDPLQQGRSFADERVHFTIREKKDFLLQKLYSVRKSDHHWNIDLIFRYNQIMMDNYSESREIGKDLVDSGFIDGLGTLNSYSAKITASGKAYVEEVILPKIKPAVVQTPPSALDIFISHSSEDVVVAKLVVELLKAALNIPAKRMRCTSVDGYRMCGGAPINEQLRVDVHDSELLIGLISTKSVQSAYVLFELGARWGAAKPLIPLIIEPQAQIMMQGPLQGIIALNGTKEAQLHQLLQEVAQVLGAELEPLTVYQDQLQSLSAHIKAQ